MYKLVSCTKHCVVKNFVFGTLGEIVFSVVSSVINHHIEVPHIARTGIIKVFVLKETACTWGVRTAA